MERIVIIGSGNIAWALAAALKETGNPPVQIFARNAKAGKAVADMSGSAYTSKPEELTPADLYIIAVSDKAIASVSGSLDFGEAIVAHTAGSVRMDSLSNKIKNRAVFYPLQTFTKGREVDFKQIPILVEGETPKALEIVEETAALLSDRVERMDYEHRIMIHIAAVFASNFTNYMYSVGEMIAKEAGADYSILKPLIQETAAKAVEADSPLLTQTGPAARNDFETKARHCDLLFEKPNLKNIYTTLSNMIWETSKKTSQK